MKLKDVMTQTVEVVGPDTSLMEAAEAMRHLDVGSLPVRDGTRIVGMITDRDITIRASARALDPQCTPVRDVMSAPIVCCYEDQSVDDVANVMANEHVHRVVVLSRDESLAEIVSLDDLAADLEDKRLVGETLERVARRPKANARPYAHILVALDGSELAEEVLPYVEPIAKASSSEVTLLRALAPMEGTFMVEEYLIGMKGRLHDQGIAVGCEYLEGRPAQIIVERARHHRADLIAMTTHGRSGLGRAVFGSVTEEVLRTAPCPVLVVRAKEEN